MIFLAFVVFLITLAFDGPGLGYSLNLLSVYCLLAVLSFRLGIMVSTLISGEYEVLADRIRNNQKRLVKFKWLNKSSASVYPMTVVLMLAASIPLFYVDEHEVAALFICYLVCKNLIYTRLYGKNFDTDVKSKGLYDTMYPDKEDSSLP